MSDDLSKLLKSWPYNPNTINARWIVGADGRLRVQLRLDLGIFQMEPEGRPDGEKPQGYGSLLDFYRAQIAEAEQHHRTFSLGVESCTELQQETIQYYYRYLSFYALKHHDGVIADTQHNLDVISLVNEYADDLALTDQFLQFYPYVRMMNARALAEKALQNRDYEVAVSELQKALDEIRLFWAESAGVPAKPLDEMRVLSDMLRDIMKKKPKTEEQVLQEQLSSAIAEEDYERAARLRDKLRELGSIPPPGKQTHT